MNYILLHGSYGRQSMRMTAQRMTEPCELLVKRSNGNWVREFDFPIFEYEDLGSKVLSFLADQNSSIINWGNYMFSDDSLFKVNKPSAIKLAADKRRSRRWLQDKDVAVPFTQFYGEWLRFPCIARPSHHHGGQNFHILNSVQDLHQLEGDLVDWYFSEIFEKTTEYRIHVAHGRVLIMQEKPLVEGELRANQAVNHESWRVLPWREQNRELCLESIYAVEVLGLDYGAVDIMYNANTGERAVCEVNTSPSINTDYSAGKYAAYFSWLIRNNFPAHYTARNLGPNGYIFDNQMLAATL